MCRLDRSFAVQLSSALQKKQTLILAECISGRCTLSAQQQGTNITSHQHGIQGGKHHVCKSVSLETLLADDLAQDTQPDLTTSETGSDGISINNKNSNGWSDQTKGRLTATAKHKMLAYVVSFMRTVNWCETQLTNRRQVHLQHQLQWLLTHQDKVVLVAEYTRDTSTYTLNVDHVAGPSSETESEDPVSPNSSCGSHYNGSYASAQHSGEQLQAAQSTHKQATYDQATYVEDSSVCSDDIRIEILDTPDGAACHQHALVEEQEGDPSAQQEAQSDQADQACQQPVPADDVCRSVSSALRVQLLLQQHQHDATNSQGREQEATAASAAASDSDASHVMESMLQPRQCESTLEQQGDVCLMEVAQATCSPHPSEQHDVASRAQYYRDSRGGRRRRRSSAEIDQILGAMPEVHTADSAGSQESPTSICQQSEQDINKLCNRDSLDLQGNDVQDTTHAFIPPTHETINSQTTQDHENAAVSAVSAIMAPRQSQHGYVGETDRLDELETYSNPHTHCDGCTVVSHDGSKAISAWICG